MCCLLTGSGFRPISNQLTEMSSNSSQSTGDISQTACPHNSSLLCPVITSFSLQLSSAWAAWEAWAAWVGKCWWAGSPACLPWSSRSLTLVSLDSQGSGDSSLQSWPTSRFSWPGPEVLELELEEEELEGLEEVSLTPPPTFWPILSWVSVGLPSPHRQTRAQGSSSSPDCHSGIKTLSELQWKVSVRCEPSAVSGLLSCGGGGEILTHLCIYHVSSLACRLTPQQII